MERTGSVGTHEDRADVVFVGFVLGHGGDAIQMLQLARGVRDSGATVRIIVPDLPTTVSFHERCESWGIPCERSPLITASMDGARQNLISVLRLLRSIKAPIVHFHTGNSCLPRVVMVALEMLRYRPSIVTVQSPYETIAADSTVARFWALTARRRFSAVASPSDHAARFQQRCGIPNSILVTIRNSIDVAAFKSGDASRACVPATIGVDGPMLLFSSRIDGQKRPVEAVQILAGVSQAFPNAFLVFVGQGDEEQAVLAEAKLLGVGRRVVLAGYQTNVADWLAAATVWLLPSERENFSVAVLEALAAGSAVVATNCEGNDEVLINGENALTFDVGDVPEAVRAVKILLSDEALRQRLGDGARRTSELYTAERMVDQYLAVYRSCPQAPPALRLGDAI